jgi:predicted ATPase
VDSELIYQRGTPPGAIYVFKHSLVQDAAYQSLLKTRRQHHHAHVAKVLTEQFAELVETQPEVVAHHYTEAGIVDRAVAFWQRAGERAAERSAYAEACSHLSLGLELIRSLPETPENLQGVLRLQTALGNALIVTKGYAAEEVKRTFAQAMESCRKVGDMPQLFPLLVGMFSFYHLRGEHHTAMELAEQIHRVAEAVPHPLILIASHNALSEASFYFGRYTSVRAHLEQAIGIFDPTKGSTVFRTLQHPGVASFALAGLTEWVLGYPDRAHHRSREGLTLERRLSHPFTSAYVRTIVAMFELFRREEAAASQLAEETMALAIEQGFPLWLSLAKMMQGESLAERGRLEEGIALLKEGTNSYRTTGAAMLQTWSLAMLAKAQGRAGRMDLGLSLVAEALSKANDSDERFFEPELHRIHGWLHLRTVEDPHGDGEKDPAPIDPVVGDQAEACFHKAIDVARRQQAKSWELRATISLARLWQRQGRASSAHERLSEIYGWFTEGFDTKDLLDARALLTTLQDRAI